MKILVVSSYLPYPLFSGGHIRLFNLLKQLSKNHSITLVCEKREYQTEKDIAEVKKYCEEVITVSRKKQWSLQTILRAGFSIYPFLMVGHSSLEFQIALQKLLREKQFDIIHIETFYVMQNIPKTSIPIVLVEHNIEYIVYRRFIQTLPFFLRQLLFVDIIKIKYWEEKFWIKATKLIAVSEQEKKLMGRRDVAVVPNGVDIKQFLMQSKNANEKEKKVLFIGEFKWIENRDTASWILREIWPKISRDTHITLWIVGRNIPQGIKQLSKEKNVIFDESASYSSFEIFKKADVLLSPIRVGGGTSFKILEAMASGVPVVTTELGREGIGAKPNEEILVGETSDELAKATVNLIQDKNLYQNIAKNGRMLIEKKYDWKIIVKKLEEVYSLAVSKKI